MRSKNIQLRLFLKKETIANLLQHEMRNLKAGVLVFEGTPETTTRPDSYCPIETCTCGYMEY